MALSGLTLSGMTVPGPVTPSQPPRASPAQRRCLQGGSLTRWLWAVGANAPLVGLPLLLHAISCRTVPPMVWSSPLALPPFLNPTPESRNPYLVWGASLSEQVATLMHPALQGQQITLTSLDQIGSVVALQAQHKHREQLASPGGDPALVSPSTFGGLVTASMQDRFQAR